MSSSGPNEAGNPSWGPGVPQDGIDGFLKERIEQLTMPSIETPSPPATTSSTR